MFLTASLKKKIDSVNIVSFDIFDTLLLRPYIKPTDLFLHMEQLYNCTGFAKARVEAERQARKTHKNQEDITLNEIYDELSDKYNSLKEKELTMERKVLFSNPEIKAVYDYALSLSKRIIIISDMYLPEDFLALVLKENGYNVFEKLYVSGVCKKKKGTGTIYKLAMDELNLSPSEILHIGDNAASDYSVPQDIGISSVLYPKVITRYLNNNEKAKIFLEKHQDNLEVSIMIMNFALHWLTNQNEDFWSRIGYEYGGPMCYAYMRWVEKEVLERNIKEILFVARDGYSLQKVFDSFGHKDIKTHYIYAPRQIYQNCNLQQALEQDGSSVLAALKYYQEKDEKIEELTSHIATEQEAKKFIIENMWLFNDLVKKECLEYENYITAQNITETNVAMVDTVTGNLSSQRLIDTFLPDSHIVGLYWNILPVALKNFKNSYDMKQWVVGSDYSGILCWDFVEYMMTSPEAPIHNIKNNSVIYKNNLSKQEVEREKRYVTISENIIAFAKSINWFIFYDYDLIKEWVNFLFIHPTIEEKSWFSKIEVAYDAGHDQYRTMYDHWEERGPDKRKSVIKNFALFYKKTALITSLDSLERRIKTKIYILGIPVLKIIRSPRATDCYFLRLKILKYRHKCNNQVLKLLGLPILRSKVNLPEKIKEDDKNSENIKIGSLCDTVEKIKRNFFYATLQNFQEKHVAKIEDIIQDGVAVCSTVFSNMEWVYPKIRLENYRELKNEPTCCFLWGCLYNENTNNTLKIALQKNLPVYIWENGFLRSAAGWGSESELGRYTHAVSFIIDKVPYFDATQPNNLETMLNNSQLILSKEQKKRARDCINRIVNTHLTKYNHQPIFTPNIGRQGVKKILVIDQAYNDMSIIKGWGDDNTFEMMLQKAREENPDADIIVKTHPDVIAGQRAGYYTAIHSHDNIYVYSSPINPISLVKYVDKIYVCSSQLGFEALMCGKEVHVFGMPFYAGWGLTIDEKSNSRRTNKRSLEEIFYIAYIMYTKYINPDRCGRCEIEDAMNYLLQLRTQFMKENNIVNELDIIEMKE